MSGEVRTHYVGDSCGEDGHTSDVDLERLFEALAGVVSADQEEDRD